MIRVATMNIATKILALVLLCTTPLAGFAQDDARGADDELRIAALEALMGAPAERALPPLRRVLEGNYSNDVKESALFVLSQIESPEALDVLLDFARGGEGRLRAEAIQVIGIAGHDEGLDELKDFYADGDDNVRNAVLEAYLIADRPDAVYDLALSASSEKELARIVEVLGAMGAIQELRQLVGKVDVTEGLIEAYAVAGDFDSLREVARSADDRRSRIKAIEAMGILGSDQAKQALVETFRNADDPDIQDAAVAGMIISNHEDGLVALYRDTSDSREKRLLLEGLRAVGSDQLWELVNEALAEDD